MRILRDKMWEYFKGFLLVCSMVLLLVALVVGLFVLDMNIITRHRCSKMSASQKIQMYNRWIDYYYLVPKPQMPKQTIIEDREFKQGRDFATAVSDAIDNKQPCTYQFLNHVAINGLPPMDLTVDIVMVHVQYDWVGQSYWGCGKNQTVAEMVLRWSNINLPIPVVGFRMPTHGIWTNLGQQDDSLVISMVMEKVMCAFPNAKIVIAGECLGSLRVERWWCSQFSVPYRNACTALVCLTPVSAMQPTIDSILDSWFVDQLGFKPLSAWNMLGCITPNMNTEEPPAVECPLSGRILVAFIADDSLCPASELSSIKMRFPNAQITIIPALSNDRNGKRLTHGHCTRWPPFRNLLLDFLRRTTMSTTIKDDSAQHEYDGAKQQAPQENISPAKIQGHKCRDQ